MAKKVAEMGVFVALAMIFSYVEVLIPFHFGIPGVKLGIANLVIVVGLYLFPAKEVFGISVVRILLMGLLFGNGVSILYSLVGGILSFFVMLFCKKVSVFSVIGVSVAGGVFHNIGQILAAMVVLWNVRIVSYLPVLLVAGVVTGALNGYLSKKISSIMLQARKQMEK
ncbi:MAG: Gx transporter family protein [Eubacteriales bacterium]|nr:Gx transporter family protein [Eubacteriales bacterium]